MAYNVVVLIEQAMSDLDATQIHSLHEALDSDAGDEAGSAGPVVYHLLVPTDDAVARIEGSFGSLGGGGLIDSPAVLFDTYDIDEIRQQCIDDAHEALDTSLEALKKAGAHAVGEVINVSPVGALKSKIAEVDGREAIVLTRPHVVADFFHLDWTHQARRALKVPVLHLLARETFDEQAGEGEGVIGF